MIKIMVLAYLLHGDPVIKPIHVKPDNIQGTMTIGKFYNSSPVKFQCLVILKKEINDKFYFETPESCESIDEQVNKAMWK